MSLITQLVGLFGAKQTTVCLVWFQNSAPLQISHVGTLANEPYSEEIEYNNSIIQLQFTLVRINYLQ